MASTSYTNNLSKLRKIVTSIQSAIQDLETSITETESIINDFKTFKHSTSDSPILIEPGSILPLSNLVAIKLFINIYTSQVKAKQNLVRTINITCGKHNESTTNKFLHNNNERQRCTCLFTRPHIALPLQVNSTSIVDYLQDHTVGNLIQRNIIPIPPSCITTFQFENPAEHLPPPLELSSLDTPHFLDLLPRFCDIPDFNQRQ